jgi:hypothetical protein
MKKVMTKILLVLLCANAVLIAPRVHGQERGSGIEPGVKPPEPTALAKALAKFDLNRNGRLEAPERQAYLAARVKAREDFRRKWDQNRDGILDLQERSRARETWRRELKESRKATASPATQR